MKPTKIVRKTLKAIGLMTKLKTTKEDTELLERIRKHVQLDLDATDAQRALEADDRRYMDPTTHWKEKDRQDRESSGRPCITEDNIGPFWLQVTNEQRKNKPGVQISPVDSEADADTAAIIQGLVRHIEYTSSAAAAYDTAFGWCAGVGRGFYRLMTDYVDDETMDQEIKIIRIPDPWFVFVDPAAQAADFSDMQWGGIKSWVSKEDMKAQYPDAELSHASDSEWLGVGDDAPDWMTEDASAVLVVEYFYKEFTKSILKIDGQEREVTKTTIKRVVATAVEVLERSELLGTLIPIVAVLGREMIQDGQRTWAGIIRAAKGPQDRLNYTLTSQIERIAFMPLSTWIGAKGAFGNNQNKNTWNNSHKRQIATLEYEVMGDADNPINAPRLITEEAPIVAVTNALEGAKQGMKSVLGMYDANLGNRQGGESGVALQRLQMQGDTSNFHLQDNLARAMCYEGRIILGWLGYYDADRLVPTQANDDTRKNVRINGAVQSPDEALKEEHVGKTFDITKGKYNVIVSAGVSYQSQRESDRAMFLDMLNGPMGQLIAQRAGDLVAKLLDSPLSIELSKRLMPQDIAAKEQGGQQDPAQIQQQMQALSQQHDQLVQALHAAKDEIEQQSVKAQQEMAKAQLDSQTKIQIAQMNIEKDLLIKEADINAQAANDAILAKLNDLEAQTQDHESLLMAMHERLTTPPQQAQEPAQPLAAPAGAEPQTAGPEAGMEQ